MRVLLVWVLGLVLWLGNVSPAIASARLQWLDVPIEKSGYEKATGPRKWAFPKDFGAHEDYQTEWWYYTGNLETEEGRPFGFQLTFFRQAVKPGTIETASQWRNNQIYSAHFTVSDIQAKQFYEFERFSRSGNGLAGVNSEPYAVWLEDWSVDTMSENIVKLNAKDSDIAINLDVENLMNPVLQGDRGFSVKGIDSGNASQYYSLVQQRTSGTIKIKDHEYRVKGLTWKDHEFSTSALSQGTVGWDWFSVQLNDGSALMLYLLRREDGSLEPTSAGKYVAKDGTTTTLNAGDWSVVVSDRWRSPKSGATYPARWELVIPKLGLELTAGALMPDQELSTAAAVYWEGAVQYVGTRQSKPVRGNGYVELTGYATRLDTVLGDGRN
jgi:predicted secreted hydrolase